MKGFLKTITSKVNGVMNKSSYIFSIHAIKLDFSKQNTIIIILITIIIENIAI